MSELLDAIFSGERSNDRVCALEIGARVDRYTSRVCDGLTLSPDSRACVRGVIDGLVRLCLVSMLTTSAGPMGAVIRKRRDKLLARLDSVERHGQALRDRVREVVIDLCERAIFTMTGEAGEGL